MSSSEDSGQQIRSPKPAAVWVLVCNAAFFLTEPFLFFGIRCLGVGEGRVNNWQEMETQQLKGLKCHVLQGCVHDLL